MGWFDEQTTQIIHIPDNEKANLLWFFYNANGPMESDTPILWGTTLFTQPSQLELADNMV